MVFELVVITAFCKSILFIFQLENRQEMKDDYLLLLFSFLVSDESDFKRIGFKNIKRTGKAFKPILDKIDR